MPIYHFFCGKCRHRQFLETDKTEMYCNLCGGKVHASPYTHPAQYSTRWTQRRPKRQRIPREENPKKPDPENFYTPSKGRTIITPATQGRLDIPLGKVLVPDPTIPIERELIWDSIPSKKPVSPATILGLILTALAIGAVAITLLTQPEILTSLIKSTGSDSSSICTDFHQKIQSIDDCYGQGECQSGYSWCLVKPYNDSWGHGCVPNQCR